MSLTAHDGRFCSRYACCSGRQLLWTSLGRTPHRGGPAGRGILRQRTRGVFDRPGGAHRTTPPTHGCCSNYLARQAYSIYRWLSRGYARSRATVLETLRPDALEVSDRLTLRSLGRWGREHGVTTVMISHERLDRFAGQLLPRRAAQKFADFANARTAANYDTVVCTTGFAREEFDRIGATNTVTVPLGVDLKTFHPRRRCARVRQHWATPTQILLVHCGRLSVEKHADRSIDALAALCDAGVDARLVIAGEGPLRARLERKATGLPIDFTGFISDRHAVAGLLASADVALAPGPHETFGLAALESLACGTPAVVSRTSALTEIITADSGACADNRPEAIAHAVRTIVSRPERHRRRCARRRAEIFTWQRAAASMLATLGAMAVSTRCGDTQDTA